jgi:hypothetical protein
MRSFGIVNIISLVVFFFCYPVFAQESQSVTAMEWKDGDYTWHKNIAYKSTTAKKVDFEASNNVAVKLFYGANDEVNKILIGKDEYLPDQVGKSDFVRYYRSYDSYERCVFLTPDCILVFVFSTDETTENMKYIASIGKAGPKKGMEQFIAHLEKTKALQDKKVAEYLAKKEKAEMEAKLEAEKAKLEAKLEAEKNSIRNKQIEKIELEFIYSKGKALEPDARFQIGIKTTVEGGHVIKSKNLGGKQIDSEYMIEFDGLIWEDKNLKIDYCDYMNQTNAVKIKLTDQITNKIVFDENFSVKCLSDVRTEAAISKKIESYDSITIFSVNAQIIIHFAPERGKVQKIRDQQAVNIMNDKTGLIKIKKNGKFGFINNKGDIVLEPVYDNVYASNPNGLAVVYKAKKYGIVNTKGTLIVPLEYNGAYFEFTEGMIGMKKGDKQGFLNEKGAEAVPFIYDKVDIFDNGLAKVKLNAKVGFVDKTGAVIIPLMYEDAFPFIKCDLLGVQLNKKQGFIDRQNKVVIPIEFDKVYYCSREIVMVKKDGYYQYYRKDGTLLLNDKFREAFSFEKSEVSVVTEDGEEWLLSIYGTLSQKETNDVSSNNTSYSNNSSSSKNAASKPQSDKKTIKNTGRKILHMGADGSTGINLNPGSSREFPCRQKIYYTYYNNGGYNGRGPVISDAKQNCGETINANGDQYHSK